MNDDLDLIDDDDLIPWIDYPIDPEDGHACRNHSEGDGYCAICGAIIPGTLADSRPSTRLPPECQPMPTHWELFDY